MALEVYYRDDIERVLRALAAAGAMRGPEYTAALLHVGLAFGLGNDNNDRAGLPRLTDGRFMLAGALALARD